MSLLDQTVADFLDNLASKEPVPGGGSVAALSGALAASLLAMVCRLTIGKKGYEEVSPEMEGLVPELLTVEAQLRGLMEQDAKAYADVMDAYKLPKGTDVEKATRTSAVQSALKRASEVPLRVAEKCTQLVQLARPIAERGNKNAASDAGVAALMAEAGLRGAALNVTINLATIRDEEFVLRCRGRVTELSTLADKETRAILELVEGRL